MANVLFANYKLALMELSANVADWEADNIDIDLIDDTIVAVLPNTHDFYNDISTATIATEDLGSPTRSGAPWADATVSSNTVTVTTNPTVFAAVAAGDPVTSVVVWKNTGTAGTSMLLVRYDTDSGGAIDTVPNGGDITVTPHASGLFTF